MLKYFSQPRRVGSLIFTAFLLTKASPATLAETAEPVTISVEPETVISHISPEFIGLGYETSAVAQTNYFSANNATLIQLYRNLGPTGLIRIGGNISDHTDFVPEGISEVHTERETTIINQANLTNLAEFARATGWRVMWGLNLGNGSPAAAAKEATAVAEALGDRLQSFEIGNEVDLHGRYQLKIDHYDSYYSNYLDFKAAIRKALPDATFSGPDVAGNVSWLRQFAKAEGKDIKLLTHHYYRTGAGNPEATLDNLLLAHDGWLKRLSELQTISQDSGVPFRINEVNSFSGGGKAGVSDTFASALWSLDYMYGLAAHGADGINLETDINQLGWISHYSPIIHDATGTCHAQPEYYGMLAFALAGKGSLIELNLIKSSIYLTAFATKNQRGEMWITVINKDRSLDADLSVTLPAGEAKASVLWLKAPAVESQRSVTLGGVEVSADGKFVPDLSTPVTVTDGVARLTVPQTSAALLHLTQ